MFEDLHWADDDAIDFVEHLIAWATDVPLLVLCTGRPELLERRPRWGADTSTTHVVSLAPLTEAETRDFLDVLLPNALLPEQTRSALLTAAEGNPLYAQEFVRMLKDRQLLVERDGEWVLEQTDDFPVPDSVHGIVAARLDALPATDKEVIQDASVVGRLFWVERSPRSPSVADGRSRRRFGSSSTGSSYAAGTSRPWLMTRSGCSSTRSSGTSRTGRSCAGSGRRSTTEQPSGCRR